MGLRSVLRGGFLHGPAGILATLMLLAVPLTYVVWARLHGPIVWVLTGGPFKWIFSGHSIGYGFSLRYASHAMDEPTITRALFWFTAFTIVSLPYLAVVRWASYRRSRWAYIAFAVPAAALCLWLLCWLTGGFYMLLQYIDAMGTTPRRIWGVAYSAGGYLVLLTFLYWALRRPRVARATPVLDAEASD